jgi:hypothetical protein
MFKTKELAVQVHESKGTKMTDGCTRCVLSLSSPNINAGRDLLRGALREALTVGDTGPSV